MSEGVPSWFTSRSAIGQQSLTAVNNECLHWDPGRSKRLLEWHRGGKKGKAFAENQRTGECFEEAGLQALISQLWSIHWTLCWPSDPQVKDVWMREEQVNDKCNWSGTQVTLECPKCNVSARRVSCECPPKAGCRPKSHFYHQNFYTNHWNFLKKIYVSQLNSLNIPWWYGKRLMMLILVT